MNKHTPGKWEIEAGGARIVQTTAFVISANDGLGPVAYSTTANAQLIAAAPDLLEALKGLDEAYCRAGTPLNKEERLEDRRRLIAARAAISKAEGKA